MVITSGRYGDYKFLVVIASGNCRLLEIIANGNCGLLGGLIASGDNELLGVFASGNCGLLAVSRVVQEVRVVLRGCVRGAVRPRAQRGAVVCVVRCGCVRGVALLCEWCGVAVNAASPLRHCPPPPRALRLRVCVRGRWQ